MDQIDNRRIKIKPFSNQKINLDGKTEVQSTLMHVQYVFIFHSIQNGVLYQLYITSLSRNFLLVQISSWYKSFVLISKTKSPPVQLNICQWNKQLLVTNVALVL